LIFSIDKYAQQELSIIIDREFPNLVVKKKKNPDIYRYSQKDNQEEEKKRLFPLDETAIDL
jgi:hypothetical protein